MNTINSAIEKHVGLEQGKPTMPERKIIRQAVKDAFYKEREDRYSRMTLGQEAMAVLDRYASYALGAPTDKKIIDSSTNWTVEALGQALPVIERGIDQLNELTEGFLNSIPEGSPARALIESYGGCCLSSPRELRDGTSFCLLRGETSEARTQGSCQYGYVITTLGEVFKVRAQEVEDQTKRLETSTLKHIFSQNGPKEITEMIDTARKSDGKTGFVLNRQSRQVASMTLEKIDSSTPSGQEDLTKFLMYSQKRAIMVAYDMRK